MTVNGVPVNAPAFQAAQKACAKYMPKPGPIGATQVRNLRHAALEERRSQCHVLRPTDGPVKH